MGVAWEWRTLWGTNPLRAASLRQCIQEHQQPRPGGGATRPQGVGPSLQDKCLLITADPNVTSYLPSKAADACLLQCTTRIVLGRHVLTY